MRAAQSEPSSLLSLLIAAAVAVTCLPLILAWLESGMAKDEVTNAPWSDKTKMVSEGPIMDSQPQEYPVNVNAYDDVDYEKYGASRESNPLPELKRKLKSRHLQMIAIGE